MSGIAFFTAAGTLESEGSAMISALPGATFARIPSASFDGAGLF
jgi:hypothetical protein